MKELTLFALCCMFSAGNIYAQCGSAASLSGSLTGEDNSTGINESNICGSENALWYEIQANGDDIFSIDVFPGSLTNYSVEIYDACGGNLLGQSSCGETSDFNSGNICFPDPNGSVFVMVGSDPVDVGDFDITANQGGGYTNEVCDNADDTLGDLVCSFDYTFPGASDACPDLNEATCLPDDPGVWYTFTTDASVAEFDLSGTDFELFEGSCGSLTSLGCTGGIVAADETLTYYIWVGVDAAISTPVQPANDFCGSAVDATGGITGENNNCATADDGFCSDQGDASVWYSYDIGSGILSLDVNVTGVTMTNPAVAIYDACGGTSLAEDCSGSLSTGCLAPGTYYIQVSSTATDAGTFDLAFVETAPTNPNSDCNTPGSISLAATCAPELFSGDTSGACPESSDFGTGCSFDENPTIWYEYTPDGGATSFNIQNLSSNVEMSVFDAPCGTSITGCIDGDTNVAQPGGTTYYIAVTVTTGGGSFDFEIIENEPPPNDICANAFILDTGLGQNTCCSMSSSGCGDAGVWFALIAPDGTGLVFDLQNISITGDMGIEIYQGDCSGPVVYSDCGGGPFTYETPACGNDFYVHVTSTQGGCGEFSLSVSEDIGCSFEESCGGSGAPVLAPTTDGAAECVDGCNTYSCDGECETNGVWFQVDTDELATSMTIQVNAANPAMDPVITVHQLACGDVTSACNSVASGDFLDVAVSGNISYFIEVAAAGPPGDFELCVNTEASQVECSTITLTSITREEYPDEDTDGPYCPGETVEFCFDIDFTVDPIGTGNNCQWIQGIIPTVGGGWDLTVNPINDADEGPGGAWMWLPEDDVVYYPNGSAGSPVLELIDTPHGLGLMFGSGGLSAGDGLPAAWWYSTAGGGPFCTDASHPNTAWGLPAGCGSSSSVEVCFDLTVREIDDPSQCNDPDFTDLKVHLFTMADGQTGCWSNNTCSGDQPAVFNALMDCSSLIEIIAEDAEICSGEFLNILTETSDGTPADIILEVFEEGNTSGAEGDVFSNGAGTINDQITNNGSDVEIVVYHAYALNPPSVCQGPIKEITVVVYPEIDIIVEDPYFICYNMPLEITPEVSGGNPPYDYLWENGSSDASITLPEDPELSPGDYEITFMVTDQSDCSNEIVVKYTIVEPLEPTIIQSNDFACKNGIDDAVTMSVEFVDVGNSPYDFEWSSVPNGLEFIDDDLQEVIIDDEGSSARTYTVFVTITDEYDCEYIVETVFTIDNGPDLEFELEECFGSGFDIIGYNSNGEDVTFEIYYDEDNNYSFDQQTITEAELVSTSFGQQINYFAENSGTYILLGISSNSCADFVELIIPEVPSPIFAIAPNGPYCQGDAVTITISNAAEFFDIDWSTGSEMNTIIVSPSDTTTYYVELETELQCFVSDSIVINIAPLPEIVFSGSSTFCPGSSTTLNIEGPASFSYLWNGPTGQNITTQEAVIDEGGQWNVVVVSDSGCMSNGFILVSEDGDLRPTIIGDNICGTGTATLNGGPGFTSYTWQNSAGDIVGTGQEIEVDQEDTYLLTVELDGCTGTNTYSVEIIDPLPPALTVLETTVCNVDGATLPSDINLNDFLTGVDGQWINQNGIPIADPSSVDFLGAQEGTIVFSFETEGSLAPCFDEIYFFEIRITDCACPSTEINSPPDFCVGDNSFNLNLLQITTEPGDWKISPNSATITNNNLVTDLNTAPGIYTLTYTLSLAVPPGCEIESTVQFEVFEEPTADIITAANVCNVDTGNGADFIDLDDLFVSGAAGEWSNNAGFTIDADNVVSFEGADFGVYNFAYFVEDPNQVCDPTTYTVVITVRDCNCPQLEMMPIDDMCSSGGSLDLNDFLINPENESGLWSITNGDPSVLISSQFFSQDAQAGDYEVTFTLDNPIGGQCPFMTSGTVTVYDPPSAQVIDFISVCNGINITPFPAEIDLNSLVVSGTGVWSNADGTPVDDPTSQNFIGMDPGEVEYIFTTNNADLPCAEIDYTVMVEIVNCNCPNINIDFPPLICNDLGTFDLEDLNLDNLDGTWTSVDATPVTIDQGSVIQVQNLDGVYTFQFTLNEPPDGCVDNTQVALTVGSTPNPGTGSVTELCQGDDQVLLLDGLLTDADPLGMWSDVSSLAGNAFNGISKTLATVDLEPGTYVFEYAFANIDPCPSVSTTVEVIIHALPVSDAGADGELGCLNDNVDLGGNNSSTGPDIEYLWTEETNINIADNTSAQINITQPGIYTLQVSNATTGCTTTDEVVVTSDDDIPVFVADIDDSPCFGENAGAIIIASVDGGNGVYQYSIDGGLTWSANKTFNNLEPGTYTVILEDGNGCQSMQEIVISEPGPFSVDTGEDRDIDFGNDMITIQVAATIDPSQILNIVWTEDGEVICDGGIQECLIIDVNPDGVAEYCATITDVNGCVEMDCVVLRERIVRDVYIPNIFNLDDPSNNLFRPFPDQFVESVDEFKVFDRWGEMVYSAPTPYAAANSTEGWDGTFNQKSVEQGVYVYYIAVTFDNGDEEIFTGSITLLGK